MQTWQQRCEASWQLFSIGANVRSTDPFFRAGHRRACGSWQKFHCPALSGTDPDRLPEEKRRGITIDLGFAFLRLASPEGVIPEADYQIGIVDVPGHQDFVGNMVAGVGSIDAALLVVAADDGWMPQTQEHLQILTFLGVKRGVVALSKIDLAIDEAAASQSVRENLRGTFLESAPIVRVSAIRSKGIDALRNALTGVLSSVEPRQDIGKPRLPVDRVFSVKGAGTVVTGTLTGGSLRRGQDVVVQPWGSRARIRAVQTQNTELEVARPGARIALNLPDLQPGTSRAIRAVGEVSRGDIVTIQELGEGSTTVDISFRYSASRPNLPGGSTAHRIQNGASVRLYHGSAAVPARFYFFSGSGAASGQTFLARLKLDRPILALAGDRFVIRDWPGQRTLGGGVILDPDPPNPTGRRPGSDSPGRILLNRRAASPDDASVFVLTQVARDRMVDRPSLLVKSRFGPAEIEQAVQAGLKDRSVLLAGAWLAEPDFWAKMRNIATTAIDARHLAQPQQTSLRLNELRRVLSASLAFFNEAKCAGVVEAVIADICRDGFTLVGAGVRRRGASARAAAAA